MALTATHFRLESPDGVEEFHIWDGHVEARHFNMIRLKIMNGIG